MAEPNTSSPLFGKKIMWIEDDKFLSDLIAKRLSSENATLIHAADGESAVSLVDKSLPDIIILDILLPGMNGFEVLEKIRKNDRTKNIPVIILSNLGQKSDIEKGRELGAKKFLIKATVTLDEIVDELKRALA
ncbi:MAG: response regulator [Candidatus Taylorbacteria bacterium]|nr:response regulator [Candidatus Taylorbacteria bacterium]